MCLDKMQPSGFRCKKIAAAGGRGKVALKLADERMVRHKEHEKKNENLQFFHLVLYGGMLLDRDIPFGARFLVSRAILKNHCE